MNATKTQIENWQMKVKYFNDYSEAASYCSRLNNMMNKYSKKIELLAMVEGPEDGEYAVMPYKMARDMDLVIEVKF